MAEKLHDTARATALLSLPEWRYDGGTGAIARAFKFGSFSEAFGFMTRVALAAQQADHHPDWSNSYDTVEITLSTHSAGGLTAKDVALATEIDKLAG